MIVNLNGTQYSVRFRHTQDESNRHTECKILQPIEGKEMPGFISIGYARCHPKDNFSKETGRQLSLKKALDDGNFSKEDRTTFWSEYRDWGTKRF